MIYGVGEPSDAFFAALAERCSYRYQRLTYRPIPAVYTDLPGMRLVLSATWSQARRRVHLRWRNSSQVARSELLSCRPAGADRIRRSPLAALPRVYARLPLPPRCTTSGPSLAPWHADTRIGRTRSYAALDSHHRLDEQSFIQEACPAASVAQVVSTPTHRRVLPSRPGAKISPFMRTARVTSRGAGPRATAPERPYRGKPVAGWSTSSPGVRRRRSLTCQPEPVGTGYANNIEISTASRRQRAPGAGRQSNRPVCFTPAKLPSCATVRNRLRWEAAPSDSIKLAQHTLRRCFKTRGCPRRRSSAVLGNDRRQRNSACFFRALRGIAAGI